MTGKRIDIVTKKTKHSGRYNNVDGGTKIEHWQGTIDFDSSLVNCRVMRYSHEACISALIEHFMDEVYNRHIVVGAMEWVYVNGKLAGCLADFTSRY